MNGTRVIRPDMLINGFGSLSIGLVVTFVLLALSHDDESKVYWCFIAWAVLGTPCCLIFGISSLGEAVGVQDPFARLAPHIRCDVKQVEDFAYEPLSHMPLKRDLNV